MPVRKELPQIATVVELHILTAGFELNQDASSVFLTYIWNASPSDRAVHNVFSIDASQNLF